MVTEQTLLAVREALSELPQLAAFSTGSALNPKDVYFPYSHAEALDPDVTLVIGNRGMGKSFWASALAQQDTREAISEAYRSAQSYNLNDLRVHFAFADAEGGSGGVSRAQLQSVPTEIPTELVWRAVILRQLAEVAGVTIPARLNEAVRWLLSNADEQQELFQAADKILSARGERILFLFDQLDQLGDDWRRIQELTQGILRLALAMRSYRSIRIKIFMRPDQAENRELFRFPDASKVSGSRVRLRWRPMDLYGLVFFKIYRHKVGSEALLEICRDNNVSTNIMNWRHRIPASLSYNSQAQQDVFGVIAGKFMGASKKRGLTYSWIPTHLADAQGEVSPRSFLKVIKTAADHSPPPIETSIDYAGIQEGVRDASENRISELQEDYPWVSMALEPLRGILVPCEKHEIFERWRADRVIPQIVRSFKGTSAPIDLDLAHLFGDEEALPSLMSNLQEIGVVEIRGNGKLNVPDIFRVNAGILRKGGITPQQRKTIYG